MKKQEHPTFDFGMVFRCMLVALDDASVKIAKIAVRPLEAILVRDVAEACRRMSEVLPLLVVIGDEASRSEARFSELVELASACGAEVIKVARPPDGATLGREVLDALRMGEARRIAR